MSSRREKVALFMPSFRGGGAERVMVTLAQGFAARGVRVDIVVAQDEGPNVPSAMDGIRIVDLRAGRVLAALGGLARYLRREAPHAMLSALPHANVVAVWARSLARSTTRIVLSEHTIASLSAANSTLRRARVLPIFMRRAYRKADAIVAVSEGVAEDLVSLLGIDRSWITLIYNPVVSPQLAVLAERPVNHPWFASVQRPVVLAAGRLTASKDFVTLIRAFAEVRKHRPVRLMILGEGEERRNLQALATDLRVDDDFALPGFVDNPYQYMKRAAVFVLSSQWEGFGNVLVEAMACGTAVVSSDCPSGPREILEGGRHGTLIPAADPILLARAIEAQLDMPLKSTVVQRAESFGVDIALDRYAAALGIMKMQE
jgi:glycosyltransferase involved in cell wall biosynthesis